MGTGAIAVIFLRALLGLLLLGAGALKLAEGRARRLQLVSGYGLLPRPAAVLTAALLPWVEIATGAALWLGTPRESAALATALFAVFGGAVAVNLLRGRTDIDCGCFGSRGAHGLSWWIVVRNAGLAVAAGAVFAARGTTDAGVVESLPVALSATGCVLAGFAVRAVGDLRRLDFGPPQAPDDSLPTAEPPPGTTAPPSIKTYLPVTSAEDWNG